jgi:hypothetical protein
VSSFTSKSHSWEDMDKVFNKMRFRFIEERKSIRYYQDPDDALQTLQRDDNLDRPYIDDKLNHIGLTYKVFRWLLVD